MKTQLSIVIPVFNEEKNIPVLYQKLVETCTLISSSYEIIFVDDASSDSSLKIIKDLRAKNKKVKYLSFSRNFGHMSALSAGLKFARGQKIVLMDADLQDPPEIILKMYKKMQEGFDVVYGIKTKRKESITRKTLFSLFYKILGKISYQKMPANAGTFSIIDRKAADILKNLPEKNKFISGLRLWVGFRQTGVYYERAKRYAGKPASLGRLISLAIDGLVSFSYLPLRISSFLGFILAGISLMMIAFVAIARIFFGWGIIGWASTLTAILFIGSVQLITLGIIGEYLARIYDEVKSRPEYIISEKSGF